MKPDKITKAIYDARDEDAEAIISVCVKKKNKEFVEGYKIGMNTAFDFVIKYCEDMKVSLKLR